MEISMTNNGQIQILMDLSLFQDAIKKVYPDIISSKIEPSDSEEKSDFYEIKKKTRDFYDLIKKNYGINVWIDPESKDINTLKYECKIESVWETFKTLIERRQVIQAEYRPGKKTRLLKFKLLK
jgi:predicted transcriptional regulator